MDKLFRTLARLQNHTLYGSLSSLLLNKQSAVSLVNPSTCDNNDLCRLDDSDVLESWSSRDSSLSSSDTLSTLSTDRFSRRWRASSCLTPWRTTSQDLDIAAGWVLCMGNIYFKKQFCGEVVIIHFSSDARVWIIAQESKPDVKQCTCVARDFSRSRLEKALDLNR